MSILLGLCVAAVFSAASPAPKVSLFTGSWNADDGSMIIAFSGKDSLHVTNGSGTKKLDSKGTYSSTDSTFSASLMNNEVAIKMDFVYKVKNKKTISAMIVGFTVDGEKTEYPKKWMSMNRMASPAAVTAAPVTATTATAPADKKN